MTSSGHGYNISTIHHMVWLKKEDSIMDFKISVCLASKTTHWDSRTSECIVLCPLLRLLGFLNQNLHGYSTLKWNVWCLILHVTEMNITCQILRCYSKKELRFKQVICWVLLETWLHGRLVSRTREIFFY